MGKKRLRNRSTGASWRGTKTRWFVDLKAFDGSWITQDSFVDETSAKRLCKQLDTKNCRIRKKVSSF